MIYCTGDTHGNQSKWMEQIEPVLAPGDMLIVSGDFGIGFWNGPYWSEEGFFDHISQQKFSVLFADGNHENFDRLESYPVEMWNGGRVHKIRHNLIHLMRGEVYDMEGKAVFVFGGGHSFDRYMRQEHVSWWAREMPSEEEYRNGERNLRRINDKVDYIITHTAPSESVYYLSTIQKLGIKNDGAEEFPLTGFLDSVQKRTAYQRWYFGHFHVDMELWRNQAAIFSTVRELVSGRIVRQWQPCEG